VLSRQQHLQICRNNCENNYECRTGDKMKLFDGGRGRTCVVNVIVYNFAPRAIFSSNHLTKLSHISRPVGYLLIHSFIHSLVTDKLYFTIARQQKIPKKQNKKTTKLISLEHNKQTNKSINNNTKITLQNYISVQLI